MLVSRKFILVNQKNDYLYLDYLKIRNCLPTMLHPLSNTREGEEVTIRCMECTCEDACRLNELGCVEGINGRIISNQSNIILQVGKDCPHILDVPAQGVVVANLGDSSVDLATRPFCKSEHYWDVKFYMTEHVKKAFDKEGVGIPYPTMDLNVVNQN